MKSIVLTSLLVFFGFVLFSSYTYSETVGEYIDDSTITAQVNAMIIKEPNAHYLKIDVTTTDRAVVLQGLIDNRDTEVRLVEKIRKISGVKSVKSLLVVKEAVEEKKSSHSALN